MSLYPPKTWVNGVDAANATNLNHLEQGVAAVPALYVLTTPYQFASSVTLSSGTAQAFTITGHGTPTIPTGVLFVLVSCYWAGSTSGVYVQIYGTTISITDPSNYPMFGQTQGGTNQIATSGIVPVDNTGKIHALANSGNATSFNASVIAYVI